MNRVLENNNLKVTISDAGAELISVWDKSRNAERIWRGDSAVWGRHAPILFPFVGKVAGGKYSYRGREYKMTSHGFARDRQFELVSEDGGSVTHVLRWNEESLTVYPFGFALYVKHSLENADSRSVKVEWRVVNEAVEGGEDMRSQLERTYESLAKSAIRAYERAQPKGTEADAVAAQQRQTAAVVAAATEKVGGGGSTYQFHIEKMEVRDDQDVERVAQELYYMTEREKRSRGGGSL